MVDVNPGVPLHVRVLFQGCYVLFYPIIVVFRRMHIQSQNRRDGYLRTMPPPHPLKRRKFGPSRRSITPSSTSRKRHMPPATVTGLLSLPPEVRNMIWNHVFSDHGVHLWVEYRRLRGFKCNVTRPTTRDCFASCWAHDEETDNPWTEHRSNRITPKIHGIQVLGALCSCRQIYAETITLLYANKTFLPHGKDTLAYLPTLVLLQRLNSVQALRFHWQIRSPPSYPPSSGTLTHIITGRKKRNFYLDTWNMIWKTLAEMEGLRHLTVELCILSNREDQWKVEELDIVKTVTRPEEVVILVGRNLYDEMFGRVGSANCRVQKTDDTGDSL